MLEDIMDDMENANGIEAMELGGNPNNRNNGNTPIPLARMDSEAGMSNEANSQLHISLGKYSKRRRSNVAVIVVRIIFISSFLFYCLLLNHSFPTNPNRITNCFKLFLSIYNFTIYICSMRSLFLIF